MAIHILEKELSCQIAAGEIIERPASIVKELVENSIDAGATQIEVDLEAGGCQLIRIRDNGNGIEPDDLSLAIQPHATSKIRCYDDLVNIRSLGFRGEALASIAAVAQLKITSRHHSQTQAFSLQVDAHQRTSEARPAAHVQGTSVEARGLFYNLPARKKFLRTEKTEFRHLEQVLHRLVLSHFQTGFKLIHNKKLLWQLAPASTIADKEARVLKILGQGFMQHALFLESQSAALNLSGWVALPEYHRSQMDQQYGYINHRYVRNKMLNQAIRKAYQDVLFHGRYPAYVLYLDCDPRSIDVNVHPSKSEVRFRDGKSAFQFIIQAIQHLLENTPLSAKGDLVPLAKALEKTIEQKVGQKAATVSVNQPLICTAKWNHAAPSMHYPKVPSIQKPLDYIAEPLPLDYASLSAPKSSDKEAQSTSMDAQDFPLGWALAQLHDIYILAQNKQGLVIVDMHAGHERVLYEKMKQDFSANRLKSQPLLLPLIITLSPEEMRCFENLQTCFVDCGLVLEVCGIDALMLREVPVLLKDQITEQVIHDILSDLIAHASSDRVHKVTDTLLSTIACKSAIKAHHHLSRESQNALLRKMEATTHGGLCNHGRPAFKYIPIHEMDQWFLRGR